MTEQDRRIAAAQSALRATEHAAGAVLINAGAVLGCLSHPDENDRYLHSWYRLGAALRDFLEFYAGRSYGGVFLPPEFRPINILAGMVTPCEADGEPGRSWSALAFEYGQRVRAAAVPLLPPDPPFSRLEADGTLVVTPIGLAAACAGGFGRRLAQAGNPNNPHKVLKVWGELTLRRVRVGVAQEVGRGCREILASVRGAGVAADDPPPTHPLSAMALQVLSHLVEHGRRRLIQQKEVVSMLTIDSSTVKDALKELKQAGYAVKPGGEKSRKGWATTLAGRKHIEQRQEDQAPLSRSA